VAAAKWASVVKRFPADSTLAKAIAATSVMRAFGAAVRGLQEQLGEDFPDVLPRQLMAYAAAAAGEGRLSLGGLLRACGRSGGSLRVQSELSSALATARADGLEHDMTLLPEVDERRRALARFKSLRHEESIGLSFLEEPLTQDTRGFDGLLFELALQRVVGKERTLHECGLCRKSPGGSLHARFCQARGVKGHDTLLHNHVKRALVRICQQYLRRSVAEESHVPFLESGHEEMHMDVLVPAGAFALSGVGDQARQLAAMFDASCVEVQCASHLRKSAEDPQSCCTEREATKRNHYSGHFDQDRYTLATMAIGSFGRMGAEALGIIHAIAAEWAAREHSLTAGGGAEAMAGIANRRIRAKLSLALHMGLSERVRAYWGMVGVQGREGAAGGRGRTHWGEEDEVPWEAPW
jgi:hypothetical protein